MFHLQVLGSLGLRGQDGQEVLSVLAQPKRTAILAYLAVASPRGFHRRDELAGLFWPESDQEHARTSLRVAVHFLRRSLGEEVILSRGDEDIGLDWERFSCDAVDFQSALEAEDLEGALRLFRGDLLVAFFLAGCPEFDRWLALERERLRELAAGAAWALAHRNLREGRITDGERMGQKAVGLVGTDENEVRRFIEALAVAGDRAAAVRFYERFTGILRDTLELEPSPATVAVVEGIRGNGPARDVASMHRPSAGVPVLESPVRTQATEVELPPREGHRKPWALLLAGAVVTTVAVALNFLPSGAPVSTDRDPPTGGFASGLGSEPVHAMSPTRVAILPGRVMGADSVSYFGEGLSDVLYRLMDGAGGLEVVDPNQILSAMHRGGYQEPGTEEGRTLARYVGAGLFVLNRVNHVGEQVGVTSSLYRTDAPEQTIQETFVEGRPSDLVAIAQQVALNLFAGYVDWADDPRVTSGQIANVSFEAIRAHLEGLHLFRAGALDPAIDAFDRAIAVDSTFSLAWFARAMLVGGAYAGGMSGIRSIEDALRHASGLNRRDSTLLRAARAFYVDGQVADEMTADFVSRYPAQSWGWYWRGVTQIWHSWRWGRSMSEARESFERLLALEPRHFLGLLMLHWVATFDERFEAEDSLATLLLLGPPDPGHVEYFTGVRALRETGGVLLDSVILRLEPLPPERIIQIATWDWRFAEALQLLADSTTRSPGARATGFVFLAQAEAGRGRWEAANEYLDRAAVLNPGLASAYRGLLAAQPFLELEPSAVRRVRDEVEAWDGSFGSGPGAAVEGNWPVPLEPPMAAPHFRTYVLGLLAGRLEASGQARARARQLAEAMPETTCNEEHYERSGQLPPPRLGRDLALELQALAALAEGDTSSALGSLEEMAFDCCHPYDYASHLNLRPVGRYLRGELLARAGRYEEALGWFAGFTWGGGTEELLYQPIVYLQRAQLEEHLGRPAEARDHYLKFIEAWEGADPHLQHLVDLARDRLRSME